MPLICPLLKLKTTPFLARTDYKTKLLVFFSTKPYAFPTLHSAAAESSPS
ncbi:hypothetical protein COLO4_14894 [Corchorus olitorius]|uniref:Uncharacterized protein n=1 Tax=Corchorus olitorius TaxID=93759 RepID=A0A1R3JQG5_9ROSI|nr:hypothetical protein COLO4_14894 [Corchorus olitorius]